MSSREIAEMTGKEHRNVMRDIRALLTDLNPVGFNVLSFERVYSDAKNERRFEFALPKRETLILISGYSTALRAKIVDRWQNLEVQVLPAFPAVPKTFANCLLLAAPESQVFCHWTQ